MLATLVFLASIGGVIALVATAADSWHSNSVTTTETVRNGIHLQRRVITSDHSQMIPLVTGAAALFGVMLMAKRKMRRYKTGGVYRDTFRPVLMIAALTGIAATGSALAYAQLEGAEPAAALVGLVFFSMAFLFLLVKRGCCAPTGDEALADQANPSASAMSESSQDPAPQAS
jgi:hypothetical protein